MNYLNVSHSNDIPLQKVWSKASTIQYFDPLMGQGYIWLPSKVQKTVEKMLKRKYKVKHRESLNNFINYSTGFGTGIHSSGRNVQVNIYMLPL
jgi:hypothetical protein